MKKIVFLFSIVFILSSCVATRYSSPVDDLRAGMSKRDVEYLMGPPTRVLEAHYTQQGVMEIIEYHDYYGDYYVLEYWDDYLINCEYVQDIHTYSPPVYYRPATLPPIGRTIVITNVNYRPSYQGRHRIDNYNDNYYRPSAPSRSTSRTVTSPNGRNTTRSTSTSSTSRSTSRTTTPNENRRSTATPDRSSSRVSSSSNSSSRSTSSTGESTSRTATSRQENDNNRNNSATTTSGSRTSNTSTSTSTTRSSSRPQPATRPSSTSRSNNASGNYSRNSDSSSTSRSSSTTRSSSTSSSTSRSSSRSSR